jgi:hypothetical protein
MLPADKSFLSRFQAVGISDVRSGDSEQAQKESEEAGVRATTPTTASTTATLAQPRADETCPLQERKMSMNTDAVVPCSTPVVTRTPSTGLHLPEQVAG